MPNCLSPSSPARKRQRLSSPTYENQLGDLTQEDLAAFDAIEARILQENFGYNKDSVSQGSVPTKAQDHSQEEPSSSLSGNDTSKSTSEQLRDDPENPFTSGFLSAEKISVPQPQRKGFAMVSMLSLAGNRSPSPEEPPLERNYDDWFKPMPGNLPAMFGRPAFVKASTTSSFAKASGSSIIIPSEVALANAKAKLTAWDREDAMLGEEKTGSETSASNYQGVSAGFMNASFVRDPSPKRPALVSLPSVLNTPGTPSADFVTGLPKTQVASLISQKSTTFKSPLQTRLHAATHSNFPGSPLNPNRPATSVVFTAASGNTHPRSATPLTAARLVENTVPNASIGFTTPLRSKPTTSAPRTRPGKFHTPFKPNMRPGEPGRLTLPQSGNPTTIIPKKSTDLATSKKKFFSLTPPPGRQSLATSGLRPHQYRANNFETFGIDIKTLNQITPETALYYAFHSSNDLASGPSNPSAVLGPSEALKELHERGCTLASKPWVDNHWCLILWKLAGLVALDPEREKISEQRRWSWSEVIRQLLYRYERELNTGIRPPLRKIANQDSPASSPMVLCISNIFWSPPGVTEDGLPVQPHPELEVTDGWYRLRAQIDLPMARAVQKIFIKVGRKIGVAGARLSTERKEPTEILEAYNSTKLVFSGNSSHLMAWHWKLGFMRGPCISTLHKLTPDGGLIAALDFIIIKVYPLAFLEFVEDEDGNKRREGPRNEVEELRNHEQWKRRRETEASKLREEHDKKYCLHEKYINRLEAKAGKQLDVTEEEPCDIESLFDKLEYPDSAIQVLSKVTPLQAVWLARRTRRHVELGRQNMADEIERELRDVCPPRDVRSFRVLAVQDACTLRRPANRTAQVTVWDVLSLTRDEGRKAGDFACGQRYLAVNLMPTSQSAWMNCESGSEIYLSTRRDTRWIKLKAFID